MSKVTVNGLHVAFPIFKTKSNANFLKKAIGLGVEKSSFYALENINIEICEGDRVALLGKNGSGKSTLLKVLAGVLPPTSGLVEIEGDVFPALTAAPGLVSAATCLQNITLQGLSFGFKGAQLEEYVSQVSKFSELGDFLNSPHKSLSAGMKGRFAVSTLSYVKPELLFMDEWIGAADNKVLEKNNGLLSSLVESSKIFVMASHRPKIIRDHCNKALVLERGKIIYSGDVAEALEMVK